ncbi:MAG: SDR family NAD(P)-dependent oxidoreductase [Bacteroidales bacterium]|nr:SDR family NAD(P)-dependent oxidoreductase [Bacteroidales bacterium]
MKNLFDLTGKVVVVTGAYGVLASAISLHLASQGCKMVLIGRDEAKGRPLLDKIVENGGQAIFAKADVLDTKALEAALQTTLDTYGTVDVLLNAAGGNMGPANIQPSQTIFDLDVEAMRRVCDLNIFGTVIPTKIFLRPMVEKKRGVIVNFCSMSSFRPLTRVAGYGIAKAGIASWTEWLAGELSAKYGDGLRVNGIAPGFLLTDQNRNLLTNPDGSLSDRSKTILGHTPFKRFLEPDELFGCIQYLISDASKAVTGTVSVVDGGFNSFSI